MKSLKKSILAIVLMSGLPLAFAANSFANSNDNFGLSCQIGGRYLEQHKNKPIGIAYGGDIMQVRVEMAYEECWSYVTVIESKNNKDIVGKKILINVSNIGFMF